MFDCKTTWDLVITIFMEHSTDKIWSQIVMEAESAIQDEPNLKNFLSEKILSHESMKAALSCSITEIIESNLPRNYVCSRAFKEIMNQSLCETKIAQDLMAVFDRDSACNFLSTPLLFYKGFMALQIHRISNTLWLEKKSTIALSLQAIISKNYAVDIHPNAKIGYGVMLDHATGIVIGETAVVDDNVSIMQSVTLGGTGKHSGNRHPKIRSNVLIGPSATILGNIEIGEGTLVGAASVVLDSVPPRSIVAGVPAKRIGHTGGLPPSISMDQIFLKTSDH